MVEMSSFSTDAGLPLFDSLVNDTWFHISSRVHQHLSIWFI